MLASAWVFVLYELLRTGLCGVSVVLGTLMFWS